MKILIAVLTLIGSQLVAAETNQLRAWEAYRTIMWVGESASKQPAKLPAFFQRLREMGINTAMVFGDGSFQPLVENHFPYYVENMVNRGLCLKFSSKVTDWDRFITDWAQQGRPEAAFLRDYCLDDPEWLGWARRELQQLARKNRAQEPLAYDIRDELSTTLSANPFDYDFSPKALQQFREWLKTQYRDLPALNAEWETRFGSWDEVKPFSTDQIKNRMAGGEALPRGKPDWQALAALTFDPRTAREARTRWNFAPWADFRTYMDLALARTLAELRSAAREVDPRTPVGIEGTQMPHAFGGYDLQRLSEVLDWVEPYDIGNAREIFGSFMPGRPILTTVGENDSNAARRRLWHLLLEGDRGCIVWWSEDCIDWSSADYRLTAKARALAPVLREMTSPIAQLLLRAEREYDPIYIHYSQPCIQVDWLLESTGDGSTWQRRFSSFEAAHNRMAKVRNSWLKLFQDLGYAPRFISAAELAHLDSRAPRNAVLVLPQSLAMSDAEVVSVLHFLEGAPGLRATFCDGTPGGFDQHGRLRATNPLESLFPATDSASASHVNRAVTTTAKPGSATKAGDIAKYESQRLGSRPATDWLDWARQHAPLPLSVRVPPDARVRIHRFRVGPTRLLALERNVNYQMSEDLKQAGGNDALEQPIEFDTTLTEPSYVYDLRSAEFLGHTNRVRIKLDPWQPTILALATNPIPAGYLLLDLQKATPRPLPQGNVPGQ